MANAVEIVKTSEVAAEAKQQFGHTASVNEIYMIKTKQSMKRRPKRSAKDWLAFGIPQAIVGGNVGGRNQVGQAALERHGCVENAVALLRAIES